MSAKDEIDQGSRFAFGENWAAFLDVLDDDRIDEAKKSLERFLGLEDLQGKTFLDIGCGSGLFSLAARRMGAKVHSFDFDESSVACTKELRRRYFPDDAEWTVEQGSALDRAYVESLGSFDVCYSWGVLHHTNELWRAIFNAQSAVTPGGLLYIAIYNDEGVVSAMWEVVKKTYCSGRLGRTAMIGIFYPVFFLSGLLLDLVKLRHPARRYREHRKYRGMSLIHDWKDWLGGYPYERARPARITGFLENLGFELVKQVKPDFGFGNNQFVFRRQPDA
jgi:2-polyprenyl-6-hydroxyphenyl methylase/3-demethylubiquinone-9 3-methyltransferase